MKLRSTTPALRVLNGCKLTSLKEVEKYIKQNKHLFDIPSTEDVNKNGINLSVMQAKLLQKLEELTLYTIEINKKNEQLQKEVDELKKQIQK